MKIGRFTVGRRMLSRLTATAVAVALTSFAGLAAQETNMIIDEDEAGSTLPAHIDPNEIRRGIAMGGEGGRSREAIYFEREIKKIEPELKGKPERIQAYVDQFKVTMVNDLRIIAFDAKAEVVNGRVVLTGYTEYEEIRGSLLKYLQYLGFKDVDDRIVSLPDEALGEKKYAFVKSGYAYSFDRPQEPHERVTSDFVGDPIYVLMKGDDNYYLCHTSEGYVGFIPADNLYLVDEDTFENYNSGPRAAFQSPYEEGDFWIPAGARLKYLGQNGDKATVLLPTGEKLNVPITSIELRSDEPHPMALEAISVAHQLLGSKYVWGGKSAEGVDCSGLVQSAYRSQGINMPRDAYMQAYVGTLSGTRWHRDGMRPGDTIYFLGSRGKIHHTALYLGGGKFLEATGPVVKISSLNPGEEGYEERRAKTFCFAKRVVE